MTAPTTTRTTSTVARSAILLGAAVLLCIATIGVVGWLWFPKLEDRGLFGDSFGVATALFSGLGFAGVALALLLQVREYRDAEAVRAVTLNSMLDQAAAMTASVQMHAMATMVQMKDEELERAKSAGLEGPAVAALKHELVLLRTKLVDMVDGIQK